jgi:AcrR family transcriptional regulator
MTEREQQPHGRGSTATGSGRRRPDQIPGGHHGLTPEEVADSQRARILEALRVAVAEQGYQDASVADIIKRAGVSRKTFYAQFHDKEDCFVVAYDEHVRRLQAIVLDAFDAQDEWVPALRAGLTALLNALAYDPAMARFCFVDVLAAGPKAAQRRNEAMRALEEILELGAREQGSGNTSAAVLPRALGMSMVGGLGEVLYQEIVAGRAERLPEQVPELMYALVLPFEGQEIAERELNRGPRRAAPLSGLADVTEGSRHDAPTATGGGDGRKRGPSIDRGEGRGRRPTSL